MSNRNHCRGYGAYGFIGRLIVEEAVRRGHRPVLAGRDAERFKALATPHGLDVMTVSLDDPESLRATAPFDKVLSARKLVGAFTPARAFGARHVLTIQGVSLVDLETENLTPQRICA